MSVTEFDPRSKVLPHQALVMQLRGQPVGSSIKVGNKTIKSVAIPRGATSVRRYSVGGKVFESASEAAKLAIGSTKGRNG